MRILLVATLGMVMLTGCTATPVPEPTAVPTQTSTPTAEPQGDPQSTIPLTCADLLSDADAQAITGEPLVTLKLDQEVRSLATIAVRQAGILSCTWGGENRTDNSYDQTVEIDIVADGAAEFDEYVWTVDDGAVVYPAGSTTSEYLCQVGNGLAFCSSNVLLDGYWMRARVQAQGVTDTSMAATMEGFVDSVTSSMAAAGSPRPAWVVPNDALRDDECPPIARDGQWEHSGLALQRTEVTECTTPEGWRVQVLPGGAWGVELAIGKQSSYSIPPFEPMDIAGADLALGGCGLGCQALVSVGGSAVEIYAEQETDLDSFAPGVADLIAGLTT